MIKALIVIGLCAAAIWIGSLLFNQWKDVEPPTIKPRFTQEYTTSLDDGPENARASGTSSTPAPSNPTYQPVPSSSLPGLPQSLESSFMNAKRGGAKTLKFWIMQNRKRIGDPRLADIELDYVVLVAREDIVEAKRMFARVKQRIDATSPVYSRLKALEPTFR